MSMATVLAASEDHLRESKKLAQPVCRAQDHCELCQTNLHTFALAHLLLSETTKKWWEGFDGRGTSVPACGR